MATDFRRTLFTPLQMLRREGMLPRLRSEHRDQDSSPGLLSSKSNSASPRPHLSVVSICGIESESYHLQIAGHKHPNSISGTRALKISFLRGGALQGPTFVHTILRIPGTGLLQAERWFSGSDGRLPRSHFALPQGNLQGLVSA